LAAGYQGGLTVEWERAWHPELEPAETALPVALSVIRKLLAEADLTPRPPSRSGKGEQIGALSDHAASTSEEHTTP